MSAVWVGYVPGAVMGGFSLIDQAIRVPGHRGIDEKASATVSYRAFGSIRALGVPSPVASTHHGLLSPTPADGSWREADSDRGRLEVPPVRHLGLRWERGEDRTGPAAPA